MNNVWDNNVKNIKKHSALTEYVIAAYTTDDFARDLNPAPGDIFITNIKETNEVYEHFAKEIHRRAPIDEVLNNEQADLDNNLHFYDNLKGTQVDLAIMHVLAEVNGKYQEIISQHPRKKLAELIELYPGHYGTDYPKMLEHHKSLRSFVKDFFTGREYVGAQGEPDNLHLGGSEELIFKLFPEEVRELADNDDLTAEDVHKSYRIVTDAVSTLLRRLYRENKEEIIKNPDKTIAQLERIKDAGRDNL